MREQEWWAAPILAALIGAAMALAVAWALLVPIFQAPDEPTHFDYALAIYSSGGLVRAGDRPRAGFERPYVHPSTRYLFERAYTDAVRFRSYVYLPPEYTQARYFTTLDQGAPVVPPGWQPTRTPWYLTTYPVGYYALLAGWLGLLSHFNAGISALFFGARLLSVLLLACSLGLSYAIMRELRVRRGQALLLTAGIGIFPLTTFVASAVQPDNLSFALVSLSLFSALRARRQGAAGQGRALTLLGVALGLLLFAKYQYYLCVFLPVLAMLVADRWGGRWQPRRWLGPAIAVAGPSFVTGWLQLWVLWGPDPLATYLAQNGMRDPNTARPPLPSGALPLLAYTAGAVVRAARNFYLDGQVAESFWGVFGWLDTPLVFGTPSVTAAVRLLTRVLTVAIVVLALVRAWKVSERLVALARRGRARVAARLALANPVVNSYVLFTALMVGLAVYNQNFGLQGRYWLPLILPAALLATVYAPRAFRRARSRRLCATVITALLASYALAGSVFAIPTITSRYYGHGRTVMPLAPGGLPPAPATIPHAVEYVNSTIFSWAPRYNDTRVFRAQPPTASITIPYDSALAVGGWALGASGVFVTVDGRREFQAAYGNERPDLARAQNDPAYRDSGFDLLVPAAQLGPGRHSFTIRIVSADRASVYDAPRQFSFEVLPAPSGAR